MVFAAPGEIWADAVTVRSVPYDDRRAAAAIRRRLEQAAIEPSIPPAAVLIVRRLSIGMPDTYRPARDGARLTRDLRGRIEQLYASAARPAAEGAAALSADAVVFNDEAEMLACLAADLAAGRASGRWWWRAALRRLPRPCTPAALLSHYPQILPAAMAVLDRRGSLAEVVRTCRPAESVDLVSSMLTTHDARELCEALLPVLKSAANDTGGDARESTEAVAASLLPFTGPPLDGLSSGSPLRQLLTQIALGLWRAPAMLTSSEAAARTRTAILRARGANPTRRRPPSDEADEARVVDVTRAESSSTDATATAPVDADRLEPDVSTTWPADPESSTARRRRLQSDVAAAGQREIAQDARRPGSPIGQLDPNRPDNIGAHEPSAAFDQRAAGLSSGGTATQIGGVLYLVPVMEQMRAPECFGSEWRVLAHGSRWAVLESIARGLLLAGGRDCGADPIWKVLAALDGRDPDGPPLSTLANRVEWLAIALPEVRAWIARALRLEDGGYEEIAAQCIELPARLHVTASHVDLVADLEDIRMPVRIAGLDIDPGWLPAWGRVVRYHYRSSEGGRP